MDTPSRAPRRQAEPPSAEKANVPKRVLAQYAAEAERLGCPRAALYRAALVSFARRFPLRKEVVLA